MPRPCFVCSDVKIYDIGIRINSSRFDFCRSFSPLAVSPTWCLCSIVRCRFLTILLCLSLFFRVLLGFCWLRSRLDLSRVQSEKNVYVTQILLIGGSINFGMRQGWISNLWTQKRLHEKYVVSLKGRTHAQAGQRNWAITWNWRNPPITLWLIK